MFIKLSLIKGNSNFNSLNLMKKAMLSAYDLECHIRYGSFFAISNKLLKIHYNGLKPSLQQRFLG
jgi:hypothetical protein